MAVPKAMKRYFSAMGKRGARKLHASRTPEQRRAAALYAIRKRWEKPREKIA